MGWEFGGGRELLMEPVQGNLGIWEEDWSSCTSLNPHAPGGAPWQLLPVKWEHSRVPTTCSVTQLSLLQLSILTMSTLTREGKRQKSFR